MEEDPTATNRANWDSRVAPHIASKSYDVPGFVKARRSRLDAIEVDEVGDVTGKSLLHLQCHIGIDTLSWALMGAQVTGVDFSGEALVAARDLAKQLDVETEFIESDIQSLHLNRQFDIVFASHGVLTWIADLQSWADAVARHLKPGGFFYIFDGHPIASIFAQEDDGVQELKVDPGWHYFDREPHRSESPYTYADPDAQLTSPVNYQWQHPLSDIVQVVRDAGLAIDFVHEFPVDVWQRFSFMTHDGTWWRIDGDPIPLTFSIRAVKKESP